MAHYTSELFFTLVISNIFCLIFASGGQKYKTIVKPGDNVPLTCAAREDETLMLVWVRPDLKADGYVFFYREGRHYKSFEHPCFAERVTDPVFKDGNLIVQLINVTINDTGRYECHVTESGTGRNRRSDPELMSVIDLKVESGGGAGHTGNGGEMRGHVGLVVAAVLPVITAVVLATVLFYLSKFKRDTKKSLVLWSGPLAM